MTVAHDICFQTRPTNPGRRPLRVLGAVFAAWFVLAPVTADAAYHPGGVEKGRQVFRYCAGCHSLKPGKIKVGPSLAGVFGRRAGAEPKFFFYSRALKNSGVVWDEPALMAWLANPRKFIPGNRMNFGGLPNPETRKAVIDYLKRATN